MSRVLLVCVVLANLICIMLNNVYDRKPPCATSVLN